MGFWEHIFVGVLLLIGGWLLVPVIMAITMSVGVNYGIMVWLPAFPIILGIAMIITAFTHGNKGN